MEPLCASATQRAMERPNPTPPNSRERALSDRKRQTDTKDRPGARGALNFDGTSMRFRNPACDGKTQSNASKLTRAGFVGTVETLKNVRQIVSAYANSGIAKLCDGGSIGTLKSDSN